MISAKMNFFRENPVFKRVLATSLGATAEPPDLSSGSTSSVPELGPGLGPELGPKLGRELGTWAGT